MNRILVTYKNLFGSVKTKEFTDVLEAIQFVDGMVHPYLWEANGVRLWHTPAISHSEIVHG
jgi:hypothetical protein